MGNTKPATAAIKPMKVQSVRIPYRPVTDDKLWDSFPDNKYVSLEPVIEVAPVEIPETLLEKLQRKSKWMSKLRTRDYLRSSYWKKQAKKKEVDQFYANNEKSVSW